MYPLCLLTLALDVVATRVLALEEKLHRARPNLFYTFCIIIFLVKLCMRSHWERNVTISISDRSGRAVFHLPLSLKPSKKKKKKPWLFVNTRSFYPSRPSSSIPSQGFANDTQRHPQHDEGPEGSNTDVNIVSRCPVIPGSSLRKPAIRNTSRRKQDTLKG